MSEAELMELAHSAWEMNYSYTTLTITLLFAYLAAAYTVGRELTFVQLAICNILYLILSWLTIWVQYMWASQAIEAAHLAAELTSQRQHRPAPIEANMLGLVIFGFCHFGSLYFMWSVRHPKTE